MVTATQMSSGICVWAVVDAINKCPELAFFRYPKDHDEQQKIADGFKKISRGRSLIAALIDHLVGEAKWKAL
jgi:hypothetical protein